MDDPDNNWEIKELIAIIVFIVTIICVIICIIVNPKITITRYKVNFTI